MGSNGDRNEKTTGVPSPPSKATGLLARLSTVPSTAELGGRESPGASLGADEAGEEVRSERWPLFRLDFPLTEAWRAIKRCRRLVVTLCHQEPPAPTVREVIEIEPGRARGKSLSRLPVSEGPERVAIATRRIR